MENGKWGKGHGKKRKRGVGGWNCFQKRSRNNSFFPAFFLVSFPDNAVNEVFEAIGTVESRHLATLQSFNDGCSQSKYSKSLHICGPVETAGEAHGASGAKKENTDEIKLALDGEIFLIIQILDLSGTEGGGVETMPDGIGIARLPTLVSFWSHKYFRAQLFFGETEFFESRSKGRRAILEETLIGAPEAIQAGHGNADEVEGGKILSEGRWGGSGGGEAGGDTGKERPEEGDIGLRLDFGGGEGGAFWLTIQFRIEAMFVGIMVAFGGAAAARGGFVHDSILAQMF